MLFQLFIPILTPVSLQESESGFEICNATCRHQKTTNFTSIVYGVNQQSQVVKIVICDAVIKGKQAQD
jgi:hypothetical protein